MQTFILYTLLFQTRITMNQDNVLILSLVLMALISAVFIFVVLNSGQLEENYAAIQKKAYSFRTKFFWSLAVLGLVVTVATTQTLPYASTRGNFSASDVQINVVGKQWYWEIDQSTAKAGDTVVFNVTSGDVNHGLGIYDENLRLLGQTQAMPGYENKLKFTFDKPGEYKLLCMEYCGLAHHAMIAPFNVE